MPGNLDPGDKKKLDKNAFTQQWKVTGIVLRMTAHNKKQARAEKKLPRLKVIGFTFSLEARELW